MPFTAAGLPYPSTQDAVTDTDRYIRELAQAASNRIASPGIATFQGGVKTDAAGDIAVLMPTLQFVTGGVAWAYQSIAGGQPVYLLCTNVWVSGQAILTRWAYMSGNSSAIAYAGNMTASIMAWGTPLPAAADE